MISSQCGPRDSVRLGMLGCGYWESKHARVLAGTVEVSGLSLIDSDLDPAARLGRSYSVPHIFPSLQSALPFVDAVVVATPPSTHAELALAAMQSGKHVLVEKPLATSMVEVRALLAQAYGSGAS
jgi:predicted dehydrogenase